MAWIIPQNLDISAYAVGTEALGLGSKEFSQICETSLTWKSKHTHAQTWLQRWKRTKWMQHLSGRILKPSHFQSFTEWWTSSRVVSLASPLVPQGNKNLPKTNGICSPIYLKASKKQDLVSFF